MNKNTEYRVQSTDSFESQLSASARRLRGQSEKSLSTPETLSVTRAPEAMPIPCKRTRYWGWIATPAAAAVGLLIGLFIHRPTERQDNFTVPVVVATDHSGHSIADDGADYSLLISL
ncbi:MAG: hypothetical protein IKO26_08615 [Paludibacteraceae bacterium]|nr:hypothetical protein [Paludibacteraceae bacterium]